MGKLFMFHFIFKNSKIKVLAIWYKHILNIT